MYRSVSERRSGFKMFIFNFQVGSGDALTPNTHPRSRRRDKRWEGFKGMKSRSFINTSHVSMSDLLLHSDPSGLQGQVYFLSSEEGFSLYAPHTRNRLHVEHCRSTVLPVSQSQPSVKSNHHFSHFTVTFTLLFLISSILLLYCLMLLFDPLHTWYQHQSWVIRSQESSSGLNAPEFIRIAFRDPILQTTFGGGLDTRGHSIVSVWTLNASWATNEGLLCSRSLTCYSFTINQMYYYIAQ